jgi:hypothetical protein
MSRRYIILSAVILVLAIANLWRWLALGEPVTERTPVRTGAVRAEDFIVKVAGGDVPVRAERDLFQPKIVVAPKPPPVKKSEPPPEPPPKTPEELEEEAARAELGQIKCVGVAFRHEKGQAFMMLGGQPHVTAIGDKVGSRFVVEKITADGVYIRDPRTNVSAQLPVSGG